MKRAILLAVVFAVQAGFAAVAGARPGDERIIAAHEALRDKDAGALAALAARAGNHPLEAYIRYWQLTLMLTEPGPDPEPAAIRGFLRRYEGTVLAERLREHWIRRLARHGDWAAVAREYRRLSSPDRDITCHYLNARLTRGESGALGEAMAVWRRDGRLIEACQPVLTALVIEGRVSTNDVWWRIRRAIENGRSSSAQLMAGWLPSPQAPSRKDIRAIIKNPERFLDRMAPNFSTSRRGRELAMAALVRLAKKDAAVAHARFRGLFGRFTGPQRAYVFSNLGWRGAEQHLPQAIAWYRASGRVRVSAEMHAWRVRAALRFSDWKAVLWALDEMPEKQQQHPAWIYWRGRALLAEDDPAGATYQFARIADGTDFYGLLAAEELGRRFASSPARAARRQADRQRAESDPGLQRALALFALDMRREAVREWNWALRGADDRFLLAAADLAARSGIYDRAINTAERVNGDADLELRYLAPYRELIEPQARAQGLELSWVYGLMRQESRFVPGARSHAGAQGLMQVMPSTGRWVARKEGIRGYQRAWLSDPRKNVMIGTSYMRMIMEGLDNDPVLASAGYNAGPGRARRWRDSRPLEGAIYAETIPFDETRRYVKKVMANAVVYGALFEGRPQSLKKRLGMINPAQ